MPVLLSGMPALSSGSAGAAAGVPTGAAPATAARCGRPVIACPVCAHSARSERVGLGGPASLRVICAHCAAVYLVPGMPG